MNSALFPSRPRVRIGKLPVDALTFAQALDAIEALVDAGAGGAVYTPNVDHVVLAESNEIFRAAYARASLSLADGMPLVWVARLLGCALPQRIPGADLFVPLMKLAARRRWRVYLFGATPAVIAAATERLTRDFRVNIVGSNSPVVRQDGTAPDGSLDQIRRTSPDLVVAALGTPKQELWVQRVRDELRPAVAIGLGASIDFLIGTQKRAPHWISRAGFEWLYRLAHEPRRLWRRYLVRDRRFFTIVFSAWWSRVYRYRQARLT